MFKHLNYEAEFPPSLIHPTGRKLSGKLNYEKGMTAITGANETGKSFSLEMLRFGLFGSAALRGTGEDYKSITMDMSWTIRGVLHHVERTLKKAVLKRGGEVLATGVSVVNEKIVKLLGFGIDVFDVACSANQDDLLRITSMKPTERRRLVDSVVGLGALEVVGKWAVAEASLREREAQTMRTMLVKPTAPDAPEGTTTPEELRTALAEAEQAQAELQQLNGWLSQTREKPIAPTCTVNLPAANLKQFAEERKVKRLEIETLKARISVLPKGEQAMTVEAIGLVRDQIKLYDAWDAAQHRLARNPKPPMTKIVAGSIMGEHDIYVRTMLAIDTNNKLAKRIEKLKEHKLTCPSCSHEFHADQEQIATLEAQLDNAIYPPTQPTVSYRDAQIAFAAWERFDQAAYDADTAVPPAAVKPGLTLAQLETIERDIILITERKRLETELAPLEVKFGKLQDFEQMLSWRLAYEASLDRFHADTKAFMAWEVEVTEKRRRVTEIAPVALRVIALRQSLVAWDIYNAALVRFAKDEASYTTGMTRVVQLETEASQYRLVHEAMTRIRSKVKQFLLPSLNRVASVLMARLTGGARTSVIIDDEFEILVDGQKVNTLSGSGKACANLAIRIALGQVLVSGVMSVFLGDEIDGSMDSFRAEETALTLRNLVNTVSQILVVSHKNPEADHKIILGNHASES
jgi:DNA repair exonuclease SbcCD ATPase subunit